MATCTFATSCPAPTVTTNAATAVTTTGATLNGSVNSNGLSTTASFEWGLTTAYGSSTGIQSMGSGATPQTLTANLASLAACTTYHFRATATNTGGTTTGGDLTFATSCPAPTVDDEPPHGRHDDRCHAERQREPERPGDDGVVRVGH